MITPIEDLQHAESTLCPISTDAKSDGPRLQMSPAVSNSDQYGFRILCGLDAAASVIECVVAAR